MATKKKSAKKRIISNSIFLNSRRSRNSQLEIAFLLEMADWASTPHARLMSSMIQVTIGFTQLAMRVRKFAERLSVISEDLNFEFSLSIFAICVESDFPGYTSIAKSAQYLE